MRTFSVAFISGIVLGGLLMSLLFLVERRYRSEFGLPLHHSLATLVAGMVGIGYEPEFAEHTFKQLEGSGSYGFLESHAATLR